MEKETPKTNSEAEKWEGAAALEDHDPMWALPSSLGQEDKPAEDYLHSQPFPYIELTDDYIDEDTDIEDNVEIERAYHAQMVEKTKVKEFAKKLNKALKAVRSEQEIALMTPKKTARKFAKDDLSVRNFASRPDLVEREQIQDLEELSIVNEEGDAHSSEVTQPSPQHRDKRLSRTSTPTSTPKLPRRMPRLSAWQSEICQVFECHHTERILRSGVRYTHTPSATVTRDSTFSGDPPSGNGNAHALKMATEIFHASNPQFSEEGLQTDISLASHQEKKTVSAEQTAGIKFDAGPSNP